MSEPFAANLAAFLRESARLHPESVAVHAQGRDWTYSEVWTRAVSTATWLRSRGLARGDRVALMLPNSAQYVACYFGILLAGGVAVALDPETPPRQLGPLLGHCAPRAAFLAPRALEHLGDVQGPASLQDLVQVAPSDAPAAADPKGRPATAALDEVWATLPGALPDEPGPEDLAQIVYTSGTTGRPKGVALSHRNLLANTRSILGFLGLGPDDSVLVVLPFHYSYGNSLLLTHAAVGGRLVIARDFVFWGSVLDLIREQEVTGFSGVPFSYAMLLGHAGLATGKYPSLRYLTCSGGRLAPALVRRLRAALPEVRLFLMYGQTEASTRLSVLMPEEVDARPDSIGRAIEGVRLDLRSEHGGPVAVGEVGEIVAHGENVMVGYWKDPEETSRVLTAEGLRTGDFAHRDQEGYLYFVARRTDIIKSAGHRISPAEIEEVIQEMPDVADAAVVGFPDELLGEVPVAYVVRRADATGPSADEVKEHCRRLLPRPRNVREVRFLARLPRTRSGKVQRRLLREGDGSAGPEGDPPAE